jgi:cephalosporin hydroxylase
MNSSPLEQFKQDISNRVKDYPSNQPLQSASKAFFEQIGIGKANYVYNFMWLGVPIIQIPQDLQALQEIIWQAKPDLIIETGIAWGGTLIHSASMVALLEVCGEIEEGHVLGIDIEIRPHNRQMLSQHPLAKKITMLEGSSTDANLVTQVHQFAKNYHRIMVCLDSNHTHAHVLGELRAYAPLVNSGSYCIVGDTIIEDAPESMTSQRPWGKGNSPKSAVWEYLRELQRDPKIGIDGRPLQFDIDRHIENKILLTGSPDGYLRRI